MQTPYQKALSEAAGALNVAASRAPRADKAKISHLLDELIPLARAAEKAAKAASAAHLDGLMNGGFRFNEDGGSYALLSSRSCLVDD